MSLRDLNDILYYLPVSYVNTKVSIIFKFIILVSSNLLKSYIKLNSYVAIVFVITTSRIIF